MEPGIPSPAPDPEASFPAAGHSASPPEPPEPPYRGLKWIFIGPQGLRSGWSVLLFVVLWVVFVNLLGFAFVRLNLIGRGNPFITSLSAFFAEMSLLLPLLIAGTIMAVVERRSILDYNLRGPHRTRHFFSGLVVGFAALSLLVGVLHWGGWLHFNGVALTGMQIYKYAAIWGCIFLMVGCFEEGQARCYLLFTLARGINFWWSAGIIAFVCALLLLRSNGNGVGGVYLMALLGVLPCLWLHWTKSPHSGFWQAAWLTSTLFGVAHTSNHGETWVGIFSAASIGFVFCVSVWVTGSAWWAIGCHAAWDWGQTYFYGTADSGFVAPGHLLITSPAGKKLWSGDTDGPEGSLLIIPITLLILVWLIVIYRRPRSAEISTPAATQQLAG